MKKIDNCRYPAKKLAQFGTSAIYELTGATDTADASLALQACFDNWFDGEWMVMECRQNEDGAFELECLLIS